MKTERYGISEFQKEYGTEAKCLKVIFESLHSYKCSCGGRYSPLQGRRQYQCSKCRFQIAPTAGTIFHKSDTPLTLWFFAIFLFANAKSGYSAKQIQRDINVTYKTAWRILNLLRKALPQDNEMLRGIVEMDEVFLGGKVPFKEKYTKPIVLGAVERGGKMRAKVIEVNSVSTARRFIQENIDLKKSRLMTDRSRNYINPLKYHRHAAVNHSKKEWVRGAIHVNTLEGFWAHVKRSINGTHKVVSKKYLQSYLDGFVFHYNQRNDRVRFSNLLDAVLSSAK